MASFPNIPYRGFYWSLGTTSYRTKAFNVNIEKQLKLISDFRDNPHNQIDWTGNNDLQARYYDYMLESEFIIGNAPRKAKDARQKTSGLVDIGLLDDERYLTESGKSLLDICLNNDFKSNNELNIPNDSYIYLKQLLKTANYVMTNPVRPVIVIIYLLSKLNFLSFDEFTFIAPVCITSDITSVAIKTINSIRAGNGNIDDFLIDIILDKKNYQSALKLLIDNDVDEELICTIGINRKSRSYDKEYFPFYKSLKELCLNKNYKIADIVFDSCNKLTGKPKTMWKQYLFGSYRKENIINNPETILSNLKLINVESEENFKFEFFKLLHLFKLKATLSDYNDLNRRYFKLSDIFIFQNNTVTLDIIPKHFFVPIAEQLYLDTAFTQSSNLKENCQITTISPYLILNEQAVINAIKTEYSVDISNLDEAQQTVKTEKYRRFNELIDLKFDNDTLLNLLDYFESRKDETIFDLVTENADVPTIFEYILSIIWYKISERKGDILDYMNLSLEADLLPRSHASGGEADIVYKYKKSKYYPEHVLLIEATLATATNQRRMEMEPVSRHLGEYRLRKPNNDTYCIFLTTYLHPSVVADFYGRRLIPYYGLNYQSTSTPLKIIPLQTTELKQIIRNNMYYKNLYPLFDTIYKSSSEVKEWYEEIITMINCNTIPPH